MPSSGPNLFQMKIIDTFDFANIHIYHTYMHRNFGLQTRNIFSFYVKCVVFNCKYLNFKKRKEKKRKRKKCM